jgi:hypothetical protein
LVTADYVVLQMVQAVQEITVHSVGPSLRLVEDVVERTSLTEHLWVDPVAVLVLDRISLALTEPQGNEQKAEM